LKKQFKTVHGNDYETPHWLFDRLNKEFRFTWDLAASPGLEKCEKFFSPEEDSLKQDWHLLDGWLWLNPPFSPLKPWIQKAQYEFRRGAKIVVLMPVVISTRYFAHVPPTQVRIITGRVDFLKDGVPSKGNTQDVCLSIYGGEFSERVRWVSKRLLREPPTFKRRPQEGRSPPRA